MSSQARKKLRASAKDWKTLKPVALPRLKKSLASHSVAKSPKTVNLSNSASKFVASNPSLKDILKEALREIADNPLIGIPLKGQFKGLRRFRVGSYRIVYYFTEKTVEVVSIADRKDVYR